MSPVVPRAELYRLKYKPSVLAMQVPGPDDALGHGAIATWMSLGGLDFVMDEDKEYVVQLKRGPTVAGVGDWVCFDPSSHWRVISDANFKELFEKEVS